MTSDILLHDDGLIDVSVDRDTDKLSLNGSTPRISSADQAEIQKALATDNLKSDLNTEATITPELFEQRLEQLAEIHTTLSGTKYSEELRISAAMASELLRNEEIDSLTRVRACEKVIGLIDDNIADIERFSGKERKEMVVEAASLRMQVARRADGLANSERTPNELKLKGVTSALNLSTIPKEHRDDRTEALYLQAVIAGREVEGTKFKDYLVADIQAIRKESNIKDADMVSLIPQAEERLIRRLIGQLENSKDSEVRDFVASIKARCEPDNIAKAGNAVIKEIEKGLAGALKASATELHLAAEFNERPLSNEMKDARIETLHRQFAALGLTKDELRTRLEAEVATQAEAIGKLNPDMRYAINDKLDIVTRELRKDPSYPSAETLSKAVDKFQASLKPEELAALTHILGDKPVLSSMIAQSVSVSTQAANADDMKWVNTYANDSRLKRELASASETIDKQMVGASKADKQQVETILSELTVAVSAGPGNNVWWGALQTKIDKLNMKNDPQGIVKHELSLMFAKAELRSMAVIEDQYIDLRFVESDDRIRANFERLGLRGERLEDAIHSYARGANALYAEREIERLKSDYIRWGDHCHESKSNTFGLGLGVPGVKYKKGESEVMLHDATLALRAQGFQGEALKEKVGDLITNISERYHHDLKMKESTYVERVEELRRHGAAAVELTDDPSRPFRAIPKHDSLFKEDKELYGAVLDRYLPKWRSDLEQQGVNPNSLDTAKLKSYCTEVFKDSELKVDFSDRAAVEKIANLGGLYVVLRDTNGGKSKNIPYLEDAQRFIKGELPQDISARMLLEARAQAAFEYCNKHIEEKAKRAAAQEYHNAGGALGMSVAAVAKTSDAVIRGVSADWVSPEAIGQWLAGKIGDEKQVADSYKTIDSAYKNLDGAAGMITRGSERVGYIGGTAAGVFLGTELLQGAKVGAFTVGKVTAMATAGAVHNMVHKDDRDLSSRLKDGGIAFAQMMILGKGLEFVGSGGGIVNRLPPSIANKLTPISNMLNPIQAVSEKALSAVNSGVTSVVGQAGNRIITGAVMNVGIDLPLRLAMGHEVNRDTLIDAALFGACFEACGVYGQKYGTFRSAASEALPKLSNDQLKELLSKESVEALEKVEAYEKSARDLVKEQRNSDISERQAAADKVLELRAQAEEMMAPSTVDKIVDSVVHPVETAKAVIETAATKIENAGVKVAEAGEFVKELPSRTVDLATEGASKVVESVKNGTAKVAEVAKNSVEVVKELPGKTIEVVKKGGEAIIDLPGKTVDVIVEAGKGISEIPGKTVELVKDTGSLLKQGGEAILNAPENLLRAAEMTHLTRGCEGSVDAHNAANKFLEARDIVNTTSDAKVRIENLREMVRNQRVIQEVRGNVQVDAQVHDLMVEMLRRGVKPIEGGSIEKSSTSSAIEAASDTGLKLDESVFKEIENAINSEKGLDVDASTIKELPTKAEAKTSIESEYAWLEEAYNGAKEPSGPKDNSSAKSEGVKTEAVKSESSVAVEEIAVADDFLKQMEASWGENVPEFQVKEKPTQVQEATPKVDPVQEQIDALREYQRGVQEEIVENRKILNETFGEYEKFEIGESIKQLEAELKILKKHQGEILRRGEQALFETSENSLPFEYEPWYPGKDSGSGGGGGGGGTATATATKVQTQVALEVQTEVKVQVETKVEVAQKTEVATMVEFERMIELESKIDLNPNVEAKPHIELETKVETSTEVEAKLQVEAKPEVQLEQKIETKAEIKLQPEVQAKPEIKVQPQLESKVQIEPKVQLDSETKVQTATETKTQTVVQPSASIKPVVEPTTQVQQEVETTKKNRQKLNGNFDMSADDIDFKSGYSSLDQPRFTKLNFRPEGITLPGTERKKRELWETQYRLSDKKVKRQENTKAATLYTLKNNQKAKIFLQNGVDDIEKERSEVDIEAVAAEVEKLEFVREDGD